ncbi:hypothetical protein JCGZ_25037 [Jatropha curcas]|uniref:Uncharacterized protein n=1 Tax=Jatropha curcas TaxID=180498 RepID=A0A067JNS7_JATCU|nr:hypothetical protein JCGZ_25037 [Jatropha curcas]
MTPEIREVKDDDDDDDRNCFINTEAEKKRIRQIIQYQKSLYRSSSSSPVASSSSFSSSSRSGNLLHLMKTGNTSLRRLFDMEHTSLASHFQCYSGSPVIQTIPLWGSETDDEIDDPWADIKQIGTSKVAGNDRPSNFASDGSFVGGEFGFKDKKSIRGRRKLTRKKAFRRLPGFCFWRWGRFRMKRLRIMICDKKF